MFDAASGASGQAAIAEQPLALAARRDKPIVVTGASGFVGMHLCRALTRDGWKVRALVHDPAKAAARLGHLPLEIRAGDIRDVEYVRSAMDGVAAVVHLAAIAIERSDSTYEDVNARATHVLVDAAQAAGVPRFIYMSQNGSDSRSPYPFLRSKGAAQDIVVASHLRWTVLRPSVIFGPEDEFINVLARLVRMTPFVLPLPASGRSLFQPIFVDDVAAVAVRALQDDTTVGQMYALGGPAPLSLRQMAERILTAMQTRRALVGVPVFVVRPFIAALQKLLPRPPVTTGLLDLLTLDNTVPDNALTTVFGVTPTPFAPEEILYLRRITIMESFRSLFSDA